MTENAYFTTLPGRGLVKIAGADRRAFLQGLISNDIALLDKQPCVYACLLTAQGKFLHDFFMTESGETIFLECEGDARAEDLARRLTMYKLRAKVEIEVEKNAAVYAILPSPPIPPPTHGRGDERGAGHYPDPRHPAMGYRSFTKPGLPEQPFATWDRRRILLTIPDGSRDMIPEKSTLLESNIDKLNGVSFDKGCYMGQELTARMHHRNLGKKHLRAVKVSELPEDAELRSTCGDVALALVKDEFSNKI